MSRRLDCSPHKIMQVQCPPKSTELTLCDIFFFSKLKINLKQ